MKKKLILFAVIATVFSACKKNESVPTTDEDALMRSTKNDLSLVSSSSPVAYVLWNFDNDSNSSLMFKDGESMAEMTSESRRFEIGKVLRVKAINQTTVEVSNFAPVDIEKAFVLISIAGQPKPIKLALIGKIRANGTQQIKYPFVMGVVKYKDIDDGIVDLSAYKGVGIDPSKVTSFDFTGNTPLIKKLKSLDKLKWTIKYHDYDPAHNTTNNWKDYVTAKDFRRISGLMINLAYMFQSDATRTAFINEPITDDNQVLMTTEQKTVAFQKILDIPKFNCGVVVNVSGLGGGATFGQADHVLRDYLNVDVCFIAVHEIGHMIGYSHSSTMTYPSNGKGAVVATGRIYTSMLANGEFPVTKSNYYMPSDL